MGAVALSFEGALASRCERRECGSKRGQRIDCGRMQWRGNFAVFSLHFIGFCYLIVSPFGELRWPRIVSHNRQSMLQSSRSIRWRPTLPSIVAKKSSKFTFPRKWWFQANACLPLIGIIFGWKNEIENEGSTEFEPSALIALVGDHMSSQELVDESGCSSIMEISTDDVHSANTSMNAD